MPEVSFEQVARRLDPNNPATEAILEWIKGDPEQKKIDEHPNVLLGIKDKDLPELVYHIIQKKRFPIVDKKLKIVFGLMYGEHDTFMSYLEQYHRHSNGDHATIDPYKAYRSYLDKGRGYYISSMSTRKIIAGIKYKQDRFDKDLFVEKKIVQEY